MQKWNQFSRIPKQKVYYSLSAIAIILCTISTILWNSHQQIKNNTENTVIVQTALIDTRSSTPQYSYSGEVRGRYETQLAFQVSGKIIKRNVDIGTAVNAGDILMQIDPKDIQQSVKRDSAQVNSAESQLRLAESNVHRFQQLYESGAVGRMTYEQYVNAYEVALAAMKQASSQQIQGSNQLNYTLLRTDKSGIIAAIKAEAGQVIPAGQPVLTIVQNGEREVEIQVPENRIEEVQKSQQVKIAFWALSNETADGKVREVAPMADPITRTYKVRISLLNPPPEMTLGMTVSVSLSGTEKQLTTNIPLAAIYQNNDTPCVWVITNNTISLRPVKTGKFGNGNIQILAGLQTGDRIVTAGVHKLHEGQQVKLEDDIQ